MSWKITHKLSFRFEEPQTFSPLTLRLRPRNTCRQQVINFKLKIDPQPQIGLEGEGMSGNSFMSLTYPKPIKSLKIEAASEVELLSPESWGTPDESHDALALPMVYPESLAPMLFPFRRRQYEDEILYRMARELSEQTGEEAIAFLTALNVYLHEAYALEPTERIGQPSAPLKTIDQQSGSPEDLCLLYMEIARSLGFATRMVRGYQIDLAEEASVNHMHTWVEAYLPGLGWRGYDPALGWAVQERHIAVASSMYSYQTLPIASAWSKSPFLSPAKETLRIQSQASHIR